MAIKLNSTMALGDASRSKQIDNLGCGVALAVGEVDVSGLHAALPTAKATGSLAIYLRPTGTTKWTGPERLTYPAPWQAYFYVPHDMLLVLETLTASPDATVPVSVVDTAP